MSGSASYPGIGQLPPEDRQRSPITGWTRPHWEQIADTILDGVRSHATRHHALILIADGGPRGEDPRSDGLAGFARTFLLAAFRLAGSNGLAPGDLADRYAGGLKVGTGPKSDEAWPAIKNTSQPMVEAAFVALALHESRPWIWDGLSETEQARVVAWLASVHGKRYGLNNWLLFQVIVNAFLKSVGAPHRQDEIERNLDLIDSWYRCDGWYTDGPGANYDYYVGWATHFYTLLWCRMDGDRSDPSRAAVYRDRAHRFLEQYRFLFAANGAPLYHGRSLTYRFATAAPLWAGALLDASPLPPGETRRIASGVLRHFIERGAVKDGILTRGWYRPFPPMLQHYSGAGAPYWASKGFLGLLLPPTHPVWTAQEAPLAVERGDFCVPMPGPGFLASGTRADGIVRVASHRSDHFPLPLPRPTSARGLALRIAEVVRDGSPRSPLRRGDPHYRKLAYSTHTAPEVGRAGDDLDIDSQIVRLCPGGEACRRVRIHPIAVVDRFAASVFFPDERRHPHRVRRPIWLDRLETASIARGAAEIRIHHVSSTGGQAVREGGFAIAAGTPPEAASGDRWSLVQDSNGLTSFIAGLHGFIRSGVQRLEGTNPFDHHSATPYLVSDPSQSAQAVYISLVILTGDRFDPEQALQDIAAVEVAGRSVFISCRDGERFFLQMVSPERVDFQLGGERIRGSVRFARVSPDGTVFASHG